jgi:hypothetical protein
MPWSYSGNPADSPKDEVRFLVGDTNRDDQILSDEEIAYLLTLYPPSAGLANWECAAEAARAISSKFTNLISKTVGSLSLQYGDKAAQFAELADKLEEKAIKGNNQKLGAPILGGGGDKYLMDREWFSDHPYDGS